MVSHVITARKKKKFKKETSQIKLLKNVLKIEGLFADKNAGNITSTTTKKPVNIFDFKVDLNEDDDKDNTKEISPGLICSLCGR